MQLFSSLASTAPLCTLVLTLWLVQAPPAFAIDFGRLLTTTGTGVVINETRSVGPFQGLKLSTDARVTLRQGDRYAVGVEAEGNVAALIDTYVENGTLIVEDSRRFKSEKAQIVIVVRRITSIGTTGSVAVVAEQLNVPALSISMGGSSAMTLKAVSAGKLHAALGGSSALKVSGVVDEFSSELGGSSAVQASQLAAKSVSVSGSGSAHAIVWAKDSLRVSLGGSAGVSHYGTPNPTLATSGATTIKYLGATPQQQQ